MIKKIRKINLVYNNDKVFNSLATLCLGINDGTVFKYLLYNICGFVKAPVLKRLDKTYKLHLCFMVHGLCHTQSPKGLY